MGSPRKIHNSEKKSDAVPAAAPALQSVQPAVDKISKIPPKLMDPIVANAQLIDPTYDAKKSQQVPLHPIRVILNKLVEQVKVDQINIKEKLGAGTFNEVNSGQIGPHKIAWSRSTGIMSAQDISKRLVRVLALLQARAVDTRFLQKFLFFSAQGEKVSFQAEGLSLHHYLEKSRSGKFNLSVEEIKNIFGQIVLGLYALHEKGIVHRDLKSRNILVYFLDGKIHLKIADLDDLREVNNSGQLEAAVQSGGTCRSPELAFFFDESIWKWKRKIEGIENAMNAYCKLDHKAVDCFALGCVLKELFCFADQVELKKAEQNGFLDLAEKLTEKDPAKRMTIQGVLAHKVFQKPGVDYHPGVLPPELKALYDAAPADDFIDGYYAVSRRVDDPFLLLPANVKKLYDDVESFLSKISLNEAKTIDDVGIIKLSIYKKAKEIFKEIVLLLNNVELKSMHKYLQELDDACRTEVKRNISDSIVVVKDSASIKELVNQAVEEYIRINQLDKPIPFYAFHGKKEKDAANLFKAQITQLVTDKQPASVILKAAADYLGDKPHIVLLKNSFKLILRAELEVALPMSFATAIKKLQEHEAAILAALAVAKNNKH